MKVLNPAILGLFAALSVASVVQADGPSDQGAARPKSVRIPVQVAEATRGSLASVNLFVSPDRGKTWTLADTMVPETRPAFRFQPPGQGTYWLACQTVSRDGRKLPATTDAFVPALKVTVDGRETIVSRP